MTRFARSTGSKASNKREPECATPWSEMVSLLNTGNNDAGVEDDVDYGDFGGNDEDSNNVDEANVSDEQESESDHVELAEEILETNEVGKGENDDITTEGKAKKRKTEDIELVSSEAVSKKKKRKKSQKCKVCGGKDHLKMDCKDLSEERRKELQDLYSMKIERKGKGTGRKKNKKKEEEGQNTAEKSQSEETSGKTKNERGKYVRPLNHKPKATSFEKKPQQAQVNPYKKELKDRTGQVVGDGEGLFHGFRVKKEDVKRLKKLYYEMKNKGIPRTEIDVLIKKERRNAENELARLKKKVCLNCRKEGHWLAQCPLASHDGVVQTKSEKKELKPNSGLCFKCGSLDHSSKECKSKLKGENAYRFAVCFICKEEGHLAKACPDNPKGLYPKGGGCVFCGSVEHLKRDCTRKVEKDARAEFRADTIGANIEDEPDTTTKKAKKPKDKKAKVVAF